MKDFFKKYWYILIVSILCAFGIGYIIYSSSQGQIAGKQVEGKDVVLSLGSQNLTADDLYEKLADSYETSLAALRFERLIAEKGLEFTDEEKEAAKKQADQIFKSYRAQLGEEKANTLLLQQIRAIGYNSLDDLANYFLVGQGLQNNLVNYIKAHKAETFDRWQQAKSPRLVSHILITAKDPKNPTDEEKAAMKAVDEALAKEDFGDVAIRLSQDKGSANHKGFLGEITTKDSRLAQSFLDASLKLKEGETSDWVESEFGFHKIKVTSTSLDELSKQKDFINKLLAFDASISGKATMELAKKVKVDFSKNPEFKDKLFNLYNLESEAK